MKNEVKERIQNYIVSSGLSMTSRKQLHLFKRTYLMHYLRYVHGWSLSKIGRVFDKDHATVLNALKKYEVLHIYEDFKDITEDVQILFPLKSMGEKDWESTQSLFVPAAMQLLESQIKRMEIG